MKKVRPAATERLVEFRSAVTLYVSRSWGILYCATLKTIPGWIRIFERAEATRVLANRIVRRLLVALAMLAVSGIASAQDKKDEISFNLLPNSQFVDYLRANHCDEPQVRATVNRGKERGF